MTATLEQPVAPPPRVDWRVRLTPLITGSSASTGWLATLAVALVAGLLRFVRLAQPKGRIFDEIYYSCDAQNLLRYGVEAQTRSDPNNAAIGALCQPTGQPGFVVHPPLGKWLIAAGIKVFGANELGWRFAAAVAGTLTVVVLVRMTRRMTGSTVLGCVAGLLLSADGLHLVQSRVAMLDVFLALWTTAAAACLVADRDWVRSRLAAGEPPGTSRWGPRLGARPWLWAAGVCLGGAVATKWSGLYDAVALVALALLWEAGARRTSGVRGPLRAALRRSAAPVLAALVLVPAVLYTASWVGWFRSDRGWDRNWAALHPAHGLAQVVPSALRSLWRYHVEMYHFHVGLSTAHPYQSHPAGWLLLARPVSYYYPPHIGPGEYGCRVAACSREVLALGTPAIWWASIAALLLLGFRWVARRDWRAGATVLLALAGIVPWIPDDLHQRTMFLFYALPSVPFLCLAITLVLGWAVGGPTASLLRRRVATAGAGTYLALVAVNLAWLYPVLAAVTIPFSQWSERMWFSSWI